MNKLGRALVRGALISAIAVPAVSLAYGCTTNEVQSLDDMCGWLGDPNNCYREFAEAIGPSCAAKALPTGDAVSEVKGQFLERKKLDTCVLDNGSTVTFDPPPSIDAFPPVTFGAKIKDIAGTACADITVAFPGFSITVLPVTDTGELRANRTGKSGGYSQSVPEGRDTLDTSCGDEAHHFNTRQLSQCSGVAQLAPAVEILAETGSIEQEGRLRFRILYPPTTGELSGAQPVPVEYFDCSIPPAPSLCEDELRDQDETDVDCGGTKCAPCADGKLCKEDAHCESGDCLKSSDAATIGKCAKADVIVDPATAASSTTTTSTTATGTGGSDAASSAASVTGVGAGTASSTSTSTSTSTATGG